MNRKRLFLIAALALALAGFTSVLVYRLMNANINARGPMTTVVVAAVDLDPGARVEEKDLRLVKLPSSDLPEGYFQNPSEIDGRGVIVPIFKNDLVLDRKLAAAKAGSGLPAMIPAGMRAVSVKVNDVVNVAGFAVPGTRVDVLVTGNPDKSNDPGTVTTTTVLENVQVLTAGAIAHQAARRREFAKHRDRRQRVELRKLFERGHEQLIAADRKRADPQQLRHGREGAPRVHLASRRRSGVAGCRASAAAGDAGGRVSRHRVGRAISAVGGGIRIEQRDAARSAGRRTHEHRVGREQG